MKVKDFGKTEGEIVDLVLPIADEHNVNLWDVRFEKEGSLWYLRVFIDSDEGIDMNKCEEVTRPINEILDKKDPISESYILEVGSPGTERRLCRNYHFEWALGKIVTVSLIHPQKGEDREITGTLMAYDEKSVTVDDRKIDFDDISYVKLYDDFDYSSVTE